MQRRNHLIFKAALLGTALVPAAAMAQMTCPELRDWLAAQPGVCTSAQSPVCPAAVTMVQQAGASGRCELTFTHSEKSGTTDGYAANPDTRAGRQLIILRVGLPNNGLEGGTGGAPGLGAWNGKQRNIGGGGLVGSVGAVTTATNTRYVGTSTDSGHSNADGSNGQWGVIQGAGELNKGKLRDFVYDSLEHQFKWGKRLAEMYYSTPVARNYWDGCSTGGRQGLSLAEKFGDQFDGILAGAPAIYHQQFRLADAHPNLAARDLVGGAVSSGKLSASNSRAIAACADASGVFAADPRACTYNAEDNMCGKPGAADAPNCLTQPEANAINALWSGARNQHGRMIWYPFDRGISVGMGTAVPGSAQQVIQWNHRDTTFNHNLVFLNEAARNAAGNPPGSITYEDEATLGSNVVSDFSDICPGGECNNPDLSLARANGTKILMWHGTHDNLIRWRHNLDYYTRTAAHFSEVTDEAGRKVPDYGALQPWFRFFMATGVGHCGGGVGTSPQNLFDTMVNWVENGVAPGEPAAGFIGSGGGRTRPMCSFPHTAIYDGTGDPNAASSYSCGGNLQTQQAICGGLRTQYKKENTRSLQNLGGQYNGAACGLEFAPVTAVSFSPLVTLSTADQDGDFDRSEYRLGQGVAWTPYAGPFLLAGGTHTLQYRSWDAAGNVEGLQTMLVRMLSGGTSLNGNFAGSGTNALVVGNAARVNGNVNGVTRVVYDSGTSQNGSLTQVGSVTALPGAVVTINGNGQADALTLAQGARVVVNGNLHLGTLTLGASANLQVNGNVVCAASTQGSGATAVVRGARNCPGLVGPQR